MIFSPSSDSNDDDPRDQVEDIEDVVEGDGLANPVEEQDHHEDDNDKGQDVRRRDDVALRA